MRTLGKSHKPRCIARRAINFLQALAHKDTCFIDEHKTYRFVRKQLSLNNSHE